MTFYALSKSFIYKTSADFLFDMIIDMGERIAGKQNRLSLIIEAPPPSTHAHQIAKNVYFSHSDPYIKNWLLNVSLVVYVPTVMRSAIAGILVPLDFI